MVTTVLAQILWQSPGLAPAAIGLVTVLAIAVIIFYSPQTRGVPAFWRWAMPALRGMAVAALAAAVAQPMVLRPRTAARQGALVVLVDRSRSMSVVDRDRSPAELVALGAGLGAISPAARPETSSGLRSRFDEIRSLSDEVTRSRSEAEYARISGRSNAAANARLDESAERLRAALAELPMLPAASGELSQRIVELKRLPPALDDAVLRTLRTTLDAAGRALAASQAQADEQLVRHDESVRDLCASLASRSRAQLLETALTRQTGLLAALPAGAPVYGFTFADGDELVPLALAARNELNVDLTADGARSDVAGAVRAAMNRMAGRAVQAIVVLSDGRQVGGEAGGVEAVASDVSASGVPIFAVQAAAPGPRRDIAVVGVAGPASARVGQTVPVRVELRGPGFRAAEVEVRLDVGNVRAIRRVKIGDDATASAEFDVQLAQAGPQEVVAGVQALDGETSTENNRFTRWIKVGAEPARVMLITGPEPGRQYASMHASLSRCAWVALREVEQEEVAALSPRAIEQQDVIVLVDLPPFDLGEAQWTAVERAARQRGASVIVCAGKHAPAEYPRHAWAARLLPYESSRTPPPAWRTWPAEEPQFRVVPASGAELASAASDMEFWRHLAPVSRYVPFSPPPLLADARALLVERDSASAVLTDARRGLGRVLFLGTDQSWRWRGEQGAGAADEREQFWPQLIRLAAGEPYAAAHGNLWLDADVVAPEPDQPFTVRARAYDLYGQPAESTTQTLRILRADDGTPLRDVTMSSQGEGSGRYETSVSGGLPAGRYTLRVEGGEDTSAEAASEPVELPITVAPRFEAEMSDLSGDDRVLRRIAAASGGQFLTLDQFSTLPDRLAENRQKQSRLVEYTLWDSPYLFGFVLACLSAEWALRKKFGLA
jgi:hypothetical protein